MTRQTDILVRILANSDKLASEFDRAGRDAENFAGHMGRVSSAAEQSAAQLDQLGRIAKGTALMEMGSRVTDAVTMPIVNLGTHMVNLASQLEQTQIAFKTMLGSAEQAGAFLEQLRDFAASTPFEFTDLTQSAKKMLALGFSAEQVIPTLRNVGNAVAGLGGDAGVFDRIILALGQMQAKGKVSAGEMKQLAEAGIPAWQALADAIGVSVPEAMKMSEKGAIDAQAGIAAIQADMVKRFGGLMEEQSKTVTGVLSNIKDSVGFLMTDLGTEIIEALNLREVLSNVQEFASEFATWFKSLDKGTKQVLIIFTGTFALGGPILVAVGAFMTALAVVTAPMLATGAIVAGIVAGVTLILVNWKKIKDTGAAIWMSVKNAVVGTAEQIYTGIKTWLIDKAEAIAGRLQSVAQSFAKPFEWLANHLVGNSVIPDMVEDIDRQFRALDVNTSSSVRNTVANTARILEGGVLTWQAALSQFATFSNNTWGSISQTVGTNLARMTDEVVNWGDILKQIGLQVLGGLITQVIGLMTQWVLSEVTMTAATAANAGARTAITTAEATAQVGIMTGAQATILGLFTATGVAIKALFLETIWPLLVGFATSVMGVLEAIATALGLSALFGNIGGAIAAGVLIAAVAGIGAALAAGAIKFADGGIVMGPTLGLLGEAGPEAVIPLDQIGSVGGNQKIVVQNYFDGRMVSEEIFKYLPGHVYKLGFR